MASFVADLYISLGTTVSDLQQFLDNFSENFGDAQVDDIDDFLSDGQIEQGKTVASLNAQIPFQRISAAGFKPASLIAVNGTRALVLGGVASGTWRDCVDLAFSYRKAVANFYGVRYGFIDRYNSIGSPTRDSS